MPNYRFSHCGTSWWHVSGLPGVCTNCYLPICSAYYRGNCTKELIDVK